MGTSGDRLLASKTIVTDNQAETGSDAGTNRLISCSLTRQIKPYKKEDKI
jgi:hypothetical protein